MNPVARLFGSLANAVLDLGLPTIRHWLRDRVGPAADVAHVTTDGSLVHLDGVKVPIGGKGLLVLERATAAITALGRAGLPEVRLHAFTGVLGFGDGAHWFRAEVSFTSSPEPEEAAWISGDLAIRNATWSARDGSPKTNPMNGHARLFVSSSEWRIEGGRLDGEIFRGRFAGTGRFEPADASEVPEHDRPLVSSALASAALALEHARVGPVLDAASGLVGKGIELPSFIPLDAELDGELSWSLVEGAHAELRVASEAIRATVRGALGPTGRELSGRIDAHVRPALLLRGSGIPRETMPREEDVVTVALDVGGSLRRPEVNGTVQGAELGFRLGRARFVPAVVLTDLSCELFLKDDRVVVRSVARARSAKVTLDLDANVRESSSARGTLRADALEPVFLRDVVRTLGATSTVPDDARGAIEFTLAPADTAHAIPGTRGHAPRIAGAITLATTSSKLAFELGPDRSMRIVGGVTAADALAMGLSRGSVVPVEGDVVVALDVGRSERGMVLRGTAASSRLVLALGRRPEVPPYVLEAVAADVTIDGRCLGYDNLRFRAHGGRFSAKGTIPFAPEPSAVLIDLELEEGGPELAEALAQLGSPPADQGPHRRVRRAGDGPRPADEIWIPAHLLGRGHLQLSGDLSLHADVKLETPRGTSLDLHLRLSNDVQLDGSTCSGTLSVADAVATGLIAPIADEVADRNEVVDLDVLVRSDGDGTRALGAFRSERFTLPIADAPLVLTKASGMFRLDRRGATWRDVHAQLHGGRTTSSGIAHDDVLLARLSLSQVAVHELPPIASRELHGFVRGRLSGTTIARTKDKSLHAAGDLILEDGAFPALDLLRPALARHGLRPPSEDAAGPVTATVVGTEWGLSLCDVRIDLRGATVRGELGVSREQKLDGHAEVTLEEEYLRTSKVLTLPRVLTERLVLPVRIEGTLDRPRVHAGIAELLGRFLKDNRVSAFVTSAVEEAQHLLGRPPTRESRPPHERVPHEQELDAILRRALDAYAADWSVIAQRQAERDARYRVG